MVVQSQWDNVPDALVLQRSSISETYQSLLWYSHAEEKYLIKRSFTKEVVNCQMRNAKKYSCVCVDSDNSSSGGHTIFLVVEFESAKERNLSMLLPSLFLCHLVSVQCTTQTLPNPAIHKRICIPLDHFQSTLGVCWRYQTRRHWC